MEYRPALNGQFKVSDIGEIIRANRGSDYPAKIHYSGRNRNYAMTSYSTGNKQICVYVHRLVAEAFVPNPHHYTKVRHLDGNPRNNRADNLQWYAPKKKRYKPKRERKYPVRKPYNAEQKLHFQKIAYLITSDRVAMGLSQQELGSACGLDPVQAEVLVPRWEKGRLPIPKVYLRQIVRTLQDPVLWHYASIPQRLL